MLRIKSILFLLKILIKEAGFLIVFNRIKNQSLSYNYNPVGYVHFIKKNIWKLTVIMLSSVNDDLLMFFAEFSRNQRCFD